MASGSKGSFSSGLPDEQEIDVGNSSLGHNDDTSQSSDPSINVDDEIILPMLPEYMFTGKVFATYDDALTVLP